MVSTQPYRQLLGRRQRTESDGDDEDDEDEDGAAGSSSATATPPGTTRHRSKRRRAAAATAMFADGDGEASSNGTSRAISNGSRAPTRSPLGASANGTHKVARAASLNGSSQNGKEVAREAPPTYFGHKREEVTRILIQALSDMGYHDAASSVSRDSGYELESPSVAAFRTAVLTGEWNEAEKLLFGATSAGDNPAEAGDGLVLAHGAEVNNMRFWLRQQKFLELLEQRDTARALVVLRTELTPLYQDTQKLHFLSSLLMCQSPEDLKAKADWDGAFGQSRHFLLSELSSKPRRPCFVIPMCPVLTHAAGCISPSVMLPESRLAVLLQQVRNYQIGSCLYHTSETSPFLYADHYCDNSRFPREVLVELDHSDEVWQVQFSHDGRQLATCGGSRQVLIWDVSTFEVRIKLDGHEDGVGNVAWSPDDSMIVSCGRDKHARIWNTEAS